MSERNCSAISSATRCFSTGLSIRWREVNPARRFAEGLRPQCGAWYLDEMSGRVLVIDGDQSHDVFDTVEISDGIVSVRSPLLFEIGEELAVRIEHEGSVTDHMVRV